MDETSNIIPNPYITPSSPITPATHPTSGTSQDTRTIVTVLLLILVFPVGFFLMWFWSKWKIWVKILVSSVPLAAVSAVILVTVNPAAQLEKATRQMQNCQTQCTDSNDASCVANCLKTTPTEVVTGDGGYKEAFKTNYMKSCLTTSSDKKAYCECTFKYLEDMGLDFKDTSRVISSLPQAIQGCKNLAL